MVFGVSDGCFVAQNRMADPAISANPSELMEVAKAAAGLDEVVSSYKTYKELCSQLKEAEELLQESEGELHHVDYRYSIPL